MLYSYRLTECFSCIKCVFQVYSVKLLFGRYQRDVVSAFYMWRLFCHRLLLISAPSDASGRLCFVIVAFPGYL